MRLLVLEIPHMVLLHPLRLLLSNRNGKAGKSFPFTAALNSLKAVIRISIFSEVPW